MAVLTMERLRQTVAAHCNGFPLSEPFAAHSHLPPVANGCNRWAPQRLHLSLSDRTTSGCLYARLCSTP
jgi:hypothetical protein